jgi:hypothetical protein
LTKILRIPDKKHRDPIGNIPEMRSKILAPTPEKYTWTKGSDSQD